MNVLAAVDSWWSDDGWRRVVAGVLKFAVIELLVSLLTVLALRFVVTSLDILSVLSVFPSSDAETVLSALSLVVVYNAVSCTIVRKRDG